MQPPESPALIGRHWTGVNVEGWSPERLARAKELLGERAIDFSEGTAQFGANETKYPMIFLQFGPAGAGDFWDVLAAEFPLVPKTP